MDYRFPSVKVPTKSLDTYSNSWTRQEQKDETVCSLSLLSSVSRLLSQVVGGAVVLFSSLIFLKKKIEKKNKQTKKVFPCRRSLKKRKEGVGDLSKRENRTVLTQYTGRDIFTEYFPVPPWSLQGVIKKKREDVFVSLLRGRFSRRESPSLGSRLWFR